MSNRVEELETKVSQLQAAVDGLTEEIVETKERVRQLESQVEVDVQAPSSGSASTSGSGSASSATPTSNEDETTPDVGSEVVDGESPVDERKSEEAEGSKEEAESESESDGSDIIVA
ncbi:chromosome segregation protein SMC [Halobium palmae]|uniref:Chromosome segregation protein SMC n=1 Tax=Halobium palmae TaxID=1776492 RepID=A0ABD5RZ29_9EURY